MHKSIKGHRMSGGWNYCTEAEGVGEVLSGRLNRKQQPGSGKEGLFPYGKQSVPNWNG